MITEKTDLTIPEIKLLLKAVAKHFPKEYAEWDKFEIATLHNRIGIPALTVMMRYKNGHQQSVLMPNDWW